MRPASCQLPSGCTDHTADMAVSAANASKRPSDHTPCARSRAGASTIAAAPTRLEPIVRAISTVVRWARFRPPLARNATQQRSAAMSSVGDHAAQCRTAAPRTAGSLGLTRG